MKYRKIKNLEMKVREALEEDVLAREDDCYLILKVIEKAYPGMAGETFGNVLINGKYNGISFEAITRARRKVQEKYPELKETITAEARFEEQKEYIKYARS